MKLQAARQLVDPLVELIPYLDPDRGAGPRWYWIGHSGHHHLHLLLRVECRYAGA
jgi:hypothetical protein